MTAITNGRLLFNEIPTGFPEPGKTTVYDTSQTISLETVPLYGGFLVKTLVLSIDPYLRGKMRDPSIVSYSPAFVKGDPISNFGVGVILRSEDPLVKSGDHVYSMFPFQEYFIANDASSVRVLKNEENLPWSIYVGVCGMPGQTAHHGWNEFAHPEKGDVVFVTTGAGPVGATVIQLAKAAGLKVIGSAGSEEKVAFMKSLGADVAFNYRTRSTLDVLKEEGPINIYWDNVGGEAFDAALEAAAVGARFIECGYITSYNGGAPAHVKNLPLIFGKQLTLHGLYVAPLVRKYSDTFYATFPRMVARGELRYSEDVTRGLERAGEAILDVQMGRNRGKSVVVVAEE